MLLFALLFLWQIPHSLAICIYRQKEYDSAGLVVLPSEHGLDVTRRQMLLYTFALVPLPLLMFQAGIAGLPTLLVGTGLGAWWLRKAWRGFSHSSGSVWARKFFLASLLYLSGMFAILTVDVWI